MEKITKERLAFFGMITGFAWAVWWLVLLIVVSTMHSLAIHTAFYAIWWLAWALALIIGVLIIVFVCIEKNKDWPTERILLLLAGIFLIAFPIVGAILLLVLKLQYK